MGEGLCVWRVRRGGPNVLITDLRASHDRAIMIRTPVSHTGTSTDSRTTLAPRWPSTKAARASSSRILRASLLLAMSDDEGHALVLRAEQLLGELKLFVGRRRASAGAYPDLLGGAYAPLPRMFSHPSVS